MRVSFVLPGSGHLPVGGFKVVYEYANRLAARGHEVTVAHVAQAERDAPLAARLKKRARYLQRALDGSFRPTWFPVHPAVELLWSPTPDARHLPNADAVIATAWETAEWVAGYPPSKGAKFYLVQHYETWSGPKARVDGSLRLPLRKLVIARWLQEVVEGLGEEADYLPNGLDFEAFGVDVPPERRPGDRAMMLYHEADWKGSGDGLEALRLVKDQFPALGATLFGVPAAPAGLPDWLRYVQTPTPECLRRLYNESDVFLATSWTEGWGLPGCEALMCGCALAVTDVGGHREFAFPGETALLSPPKDPAKMAENVLTLLQNPDLRVRLARQGNTFVQRFTWEGAVGRLEGALERAAG